MNFFLPGCSAFGETEETALEEVKIAIELWLETAKKRWAYNMRVAPQIALSGNSRKCAYSVF
jgi:hypothetical protein